MESSGNIRNNTDVCIFIKILNDSDIAYNTDIMKCVS